jgi:hypothetical protein
MLHRWHLRGGKKRGRKVGKTKRGKGTKRMAIADAAGLPLAVHPASANLYFVTLVEATLDAIVTVGLPERLIGDRAYDSDPLDEKLAANGIELIAPHRSGRVKAATQDGRDNQIAGNPDWRTYPPGLLPLGVANGQRIECRSGRQGWLRRPFP